MENVYFLEIILSLKIRILEVNLFGFKFLVILFIRNEIIGKFVFF